MNWHKCMQTESVDKLQYEESPCSNLGVSSTPKNQLIDTESEIFNFLGKPKRVIETKKISSHNEQLHYQKDQFLNNTFQKIFSHSNSKEKHIHESKNTEEEWYLSAVMVGSNLNERNFDCNFNKSSPCKKMKQEDLLIKTDKQIWDSKKGKKRLTFNTEDFLSPIESSIDNKEPELLSTSSLPYDDNISDNAAMITDSSDLLLRLKSIKMQIKELTELSET